MPCITVDCIVLIYALTLSNVKKDAYSGEENEQILNDIRILYNCSNGGKHEKWLF